MYKLMDNLECANCIPNDSSLAVAEAVERKVDGIATSWQHKPPPCSAVQQHEIVIHVEPPRIQILARRNHVISDGAFNQWLK